MLKYKRKLRYIIDYYISSKRLVKIINDVIRQLSLSDGWQIVKGENCCILYQAGSGSAFRFDWNNYVSNFVSIVVYCGIFEQQRPITSAFLGVRYHQQGDNLKTQQWVWLPRISTEGPTSYDVKYLLTQKRYKWKVARVGRGTDTPFSEGMTSEEITEGLVEAFAKDFNEYASKLRILIA